VPVGDLFQAAIWPGVMLVGAYIVYILIYAKLNPEAAQPIERDDSISRKQEVINALKAIVPPLALIIVVLGSIFAGVATPTESAALGGAGAMVLALLYGQFSWSMVYDASKETVKVTAMVFAILLGATAFSMAFTYTGGDYLVEEWMLQLPGDKWGFLLITMLVILILGFFIDFVEICFIIVPIIAPVAELMGINMTWFAILVAMNLQTSFLTPPFGFSLFYLKGVAPKGVTTKDIYRGVMPFILIQILVLGSLLAFPSFYGM
jgi:tripartite ATP-independent transporter DctM subunit